MKKKVLFMMPSMFIGGAERSLLGLFELFDYSKYDVFLFLYRHEGEFLSYIPPQVHLLPEIDQYKTFDVPIKSLLFSKKILFGIARLLSKFSLKIHCLFSREKPGVWMQMQYSSKFLLPLLPPISGEYDTGIMFLGISDVLVKKVKAKMKCTWNHTDYTTLLPSRKRDLHIYENINKIISVSDSCTEAFVKFYPTLRDKAITIENLLAVRLIKEQAEQPVEGMNRVNNSHFLLSIGRFSEAKNFDNIPDICKKIRDKGIDIVWYIIGYGGQELLIRQKISESGMQDYVIILGKKTNPYPYIKACDIYVQPSRYEGKAVTVREAQILGKPVVISRFQTSSSQLTDGFDGMIVPMNNAECAKEIAALILDKNLQERFIKNTKNTDYSNKTEVEKIYSLMG